MLAEELTQVNKGGGPAKGMPMRAETFDYQPTKTIDDKDRLVIQGRLNVDTTTAGAHYWGSHKQGAKKPMGLQTEQCLRRSTYLLVSLHPGADFPSD